MRSRELHGKGNSPKHSPASKSSSLTKPAKSLPFIVVFTRRESQVGLTALLPPSKVRPMKTATPLLVSLAEAGFQLSLPEEDIIALIRKGDLIAVKVRGQILIIYDSLTAFTRRAKRNSAVVEVGQEIQG